MSNVINKSSHPVEIKKISLSTWTLRDEIEAAISEKLSASESESVDIEDIKAFYITNLDRPVASEPNDSDEDERNGNDDENLDSSGNPIDDDAAAMMAALAGGGEGDEGEAQGEAEGDEGQDNDEAETPEASEEDPDSTATSEVDDEASRLAAEMLGDQDVSQNLLEESMIAESMLPNKASPDSQTMAKEPFKRVIPSKSKQIAAFLMLSDINMDEVLFFSQGSLVQGQNIVIQFNIPKSFNLLATVIKCHDISRKSKIISKTKPSHRIHARFEYKFSGERNTLREFLKSIEPTIPTPPKKLKKPASEEEDDDDFSDLGF